MLAALEALAASLLTPEAAEAAEVVLQASEAKMVSRAKQESKGYKGYKDLPDQQAPLALPDLKVLQDKTDHPLAPTDTLTSSSALYMTQAINASKQQRTESTCSELTQDPKTALEHHHQAMALVLLPVQQNVTHDPSVSPQRQSANPSYCSN